MLMKFGIRSLATQKLAILALGVVKQSKSHPRIRLFGMMAGIDPEHYKSKKTETKKAKKGQDSTAPTRLKDLDSVIEMALGRLEQYQSNGDPEQLQLDPKAVRIILS
eukprot:CAMPEP_0119490880 /NCGR_PEP_ID=MMETSP1344-20130328/15923_1 /TAXON_ID=236787 /ORGANISM="Florenciella parvula, Strain CCMP2471" /LENGTH=106 /DNA_ID=CAMNT_0007526079 /DNA_START=1 /DNA_END=317 /DNA_ORIENTATION=+